MHLLLLLISLNTCFFALELMQTRFGALTNNGPRVHAIFRQLLSQIFISELCHLFLLLLFLRPGLVCLPGCFLRENV